MLARRGARGSNYTFLTQKERDIETGLDYSQFRYYSSTQGRFTSIDPLTASASVARPQSWNRYTYCANNPLNYIDPTGLDWYRDTTETGTIHPVWLDDDPGKKSKYVAWDGPWTYQSSESHKWIVLSNSSSQQSEYATQEAALASLALPEHDWDPSCANCAELSHEMNRYTPALTQSMNIMGTYMFLFTGPTGEIGELTSLGVETSEIGSGGFDFAVGLSEHIDQFAEETNSLHYGQLNGGDWTFAPENFEAFANQADKIHFNTQGFDFARWGRWAINDGQWSIPRGTVTNWELHEILRHPNWMVKTTFH